MVDKSPLVSPKLSFSTLTTGAIQLVVQDALEMILCFLVSYLSSFTPRTMVISSFLAGAEMIIFLAPPGMFCAPYYWGESWVTSFYCVSVLALLLASKYLDFGRISKLLELTGEGCPIETCLTLVLVV